MRKASKKPAGESRRAFIRNAGMAAAGMMIVPRHVLGRGFQAPSDRLNIAVVGYSSGAWVSMISGPSWPAATISWRCATSTRLRPERPAEGPHDRTSRWEETTAFLNAFPASGRYRDYRVMLEKRKDIDAVVVATPDHTHAVIAMAAMQLGKHVHVQKPMTHTVSEARALTEAARRYKVISQMGNQGHSAEGIRLIQEWINDGAIGAVREVHSWTNRPIWAQGMPRPTQTSAVPAGLDWDLWLGPAAPRPYHRVYHPFSWRAWQDFGCGSLGDMGCHILDAPYTALNSRLPVCSATRRSS